MAMNKVIQDDEAKAETIRLLKEHQRNLEQEEIKEKNHAKNLAKAEREA